MLGTLMSCGAPGHPSGFGPGSSGSHAPFVRAGIQVPASTMQFFDRAGQSVIGRD